MTCCIDSRNRTNFDQHPNTCHFQLQNGVLVTQAQLMSFSFTNLFYNITTQNNVIYIDNQIAATIQPKFWNASDFVSELNSQLKTFLNQESDVVTLDTNSNELNWTLADHTITYSSMINVLGITNNTSGIFTSQLTLFGPLTVLIDCAQLNQRTFNTTFGFAANTNQYLFGIPVNSSYLEVQNFQPDSKYVQYYDPGLLINTLDITFRDQATGQLLNIGEWSMILEIQ